MTKPLPLFPLPALFLALTLSLSPALRSQNLSDPQLLDLIHQQPPLSSGQLKTILLDNSPLSDTVLIAAFTRQPALPNGVISEIALANSPLSNKVLFVLKDLDPALPPGILNEVFSENTLTIHGRLLNSAGCDTSLQLAGVEVALADLSGNPVTSAVATGPQGEFSIDPDEVAALNLSALFTFVLLSDIPLSLSAPRTPEDWMRQSPVSLFAENTLSASFTFAFASNACFDFLSEDFPEMDFAADFPGGVAPYTYQWDFGDGNEDEGESPTNVYEEPGAFTVSLTVIDSLRCVSIAQQQITIENCPMGVLFNNDACGGGPAEGIALSIRLLIQEEGVNELLFEDFIATTNAAGEFSFDPDDINDLRGDLNDLYPIVPLVAFEPLEGLGIEDQQFVPIDDLLGDLPVSLTLSSSTIAWHDHQGEATLEDAIDDDPRASVATAIDVHGHVFVAGAIMDNLGSIGSASFGVIKYDRSGNALWIREFANATGSQPGNTPTAIAVTDNCEVYVTGVGAEGGGATHYLTVKYDAAGNLLWSRTYTGSPSVSSQNLARAIAQDACGNIYVTGRSIDGSTGDAGDYGTVKYDPDGNLLWAATYKGPATGGGKLDEALAITARNGKVFVTGYSRGATSRDIATVAYDESGSELWAARYDGAGSGEDLARDIAADITGNVYVTGYSTESGSDRDMIVIKYDAEGDELWTATHPGAANAGDEAFALAVHSDGSVYVTGAAAETGLEFPDAFLITQGEDGGLFDFDMVTNRYGADGSLLWSRSYDGAGATLDGAFDIALDQNGNAYITGVTHSLSKNKAAFAMAFGINSSATIFVSGPGFGTIQLDPPPLVAFGTGEATTLSYDADGGERWVHTYKGAGNSQDGFFALALDDGGGVYATGFSALVDTVTFDVNVKMSTVKVGQCDGAGAVINPFLCNAVCVTNTNDDGEGSLRWAIDLANEGQGDTIAFCIPGMSPHRILLESELPSIVRDGIVLDGTSQDANGYEGIEARVIIDGQMNVGKGIAVDGASNVAVWGLEITNIAGSGMEIADCEDFRIGGAGKGNVLVSNKGNGLLISNSSGGLVQGNSIGTNRGQEPFKGNDSLGILIEGNSAGIAIGGSESDQWNILAYNGREGICVCNPDAGQVTITGNSFFCNSLQEDGGGITLVPGANGGIQPPVFFNDAFNPGIASGAAAAGATVSIYRSDDCGTCEGTLPLATVQANAAGSWSAGDMSAAGRITAIATDSAGNSSGFSSCTTPGSPGVEKCGAETLLNRLLATDSVSARRFREGNELLRAAIETGNFINAPPPYTIPVVVHVVFDPAVSATNVADEQIDAMIHALNRGFANTNPDPGPRAVNTQIQFCLATVDNQGNGSGQWPGGKDGVTRHNNAPQSSVIMNSAGKTDLRNVVYFDPARYLNIYVVRDITDPLNPGNNVAGFSSMPYKLPGEILDGVVMHHGFFADNSVCANFPLKNPPNDEGDVLIHEVGHYLGLFHTFHIEFGGQCEGSGSTTCDNRGDLVCDTPPTAAAGSGCPLSPPNTCAETYAPYGGAPSEPDQIENYMDYYDDACMNTFTNGQAQRMHAAIDKYRSTLVQGTIPAKCAPEPFGFICVTNTTVCLNQLTAFEAKPDLVGYGYNWDFDGSSTAAGRNVSHTYTTLGNFTVKVTVTDPGGKNFKQELPITVDNCAITTREKANWYFGNRVALDFNGGNAVPVAPPSIMNTYEAAASISDAAGDLQFYTQGQEVYIPTGGGHTRMPAVTPGRTPHLNGSPNTAPPGAANSASGMQAAVIVPDPADESSGNYFIFTVSDNYNIGTTGNVPNRRHGLTYYRVDMNLGADGMIVTGDNGVQPVENYTTTEAVTAIPNCSSDGYWIIVHGIDNASLNDRDGNPVQAGPGLALPGGGPLPVNQALLAYEFRGDGGGDGILAPSPVASPSAFTVDPDPIGPGERGNAWQMNIEVSRDGSLVAISNRTAGEAGETNLYRFDRATGIFTLITQLGVPSTGVCFSPSGLFLYVNTSSTGTIVQYNLADLDFCTVLPAPETAGSSVSSTLNNMQLGPDNRIYISENTMSALSFINNPDQNCSTGCGFSAGGLNLLANQTCSYNLPNDIDAMPPIERLAFSACEDGCGAVDFIAFGCAANVLWDFDFVNNPGVSVSTDRNPEHRYTSAGTYRVCLTDGTIQTCRDITVNTVYFAAAAVTDALCHGSCDGDATLTVTGGTPPYVYLWNDANSQTTPAATGLCAGAYTVTVTDAAGCELTEEVEIHEPEEIFTDITAAEPTQCDAPCDGTLDAVVSGGTPGYVVQWSDGATGVSRNALCPGEYGLTVTDANGCTVTDQAVLNDDACPTACGIAATVVILPSVTPSQATDHPCPASPPTGPFCLVNEVVDLETDFEVNTDFTFTGSDVRIAAGKKITVLSSFTLTITGGSRLYSCTEMWQGIVVQPGAKLVVVGGSSVEDAVTAIRPLGSTALVTLSNATLNKNYIHVDIDNTTAPIPNLSEFRGSRFFCRSSTTSPGNTLKSPHTDQRTFAGIKVLNGEMTIGDPSAKDNVFDNLDYGIHLTDATALIRNNIFTNFTGEQVFCPPGSFCPDPVGLAIRARHVFTVRHKALTVGGPSPSDANGFSDCFRAVDIENYTEITVQNNSIENPNQGAVFQGPVGDHGVFWKATAISTERIFISGNVISNTGTGIHLLKTVNFQTLRVSVTGNTIRAAGSGHVGTPILLEDVLSQPGFVHDVTGNVMLRTRNGILLRMVTRPLVENNTMDLSPTFAGAGIRAEGGSPVIRANEITSTNTDFSITRERFRGIYATLAAGSDVNCNRIKNFGQSMVFEDVMPSRVENNEMTNARDGLVLLNNGQIGPQGASGRPSDNVWMGSYVNSQTFTDNTVGANTNSPLWVRPGVRTNPTDNETNSANPSFDQYNPLTTGGPHRSCPLPEEPVIGPLGAIAAGNDSSFSVFPEETKWLANFMAFEAIMADSSGQLHAAHESFFDSIKQTNKGKVCRINKLFREDDLAAASAENIGLQPSCAIEKNHKDFNAMLLAWMEGKHEAISIPALYAIASQCPLQGGFAVYQARTLLNAISDRVNEFDDKCPVVAASKTNEAPAAGPEETFEYKLYPNPSDGTMQLDYRLGWKETGRFEVYDLTGRQWITEQLENDKATLYIKIEDLPAGAYLYRIIVNKEARAGDKLIIIK